jgi:hypothetical protein
MPCPATELDAIELLTAVWRGACTLKKQRVRWDDFAEKHDGSGGAFGHSMPCPY